MPSIMQHHDKIIAVVDPVLVAGPMNELIMHEARVERKIQSWEHPLYHQIQRDLSSLTAACGAIPWTKYVSVDDVLIFHGLDHSC